MHATINENPAYIGELNAAARDESQILRGR